MKLSGYNRNWMTGARGEKPVLCRLVWVQINSNYGSRYDILRYWALRNRLFVDVGGYASQVHFQYGEGFYVQPEGKPMAHKSKLSVSQIVMYGYLFTNGIN